MILRAITSTLFVLVLCAADDVNKWSKPLIGAERKSNDWVPLQIPCPMCAQDQVPKGSAIVPGIIAPPLHSHSIPRALINHEALRGFLQSLEPVNFGQGQFRQESGEAEKFIQPHLLHQPQPFLHGPQLQPQHQVFSQQIPPPHLINQQFLPPNLQPPPNYVDPLFLEQQKHNERFQHPQVPIIFNNPNPVGNRLPVGQRDIFTITSNNPLLPTANVNYEKLQQPEINNNSTNDKFISPKYNYTNHEDNIKEEVQILYVPVETLKQKGKNIDAHKLEQKNKLRPSNLEYQITRNVNEKFPIKTETKFQHPIQPLKDQRPANFENQELKNVREHTRHLFNRRPNYDDQQYHKKNDSFISTPELSSLNSQHHIQHNTLHNKKPPSIMDETFSDSYKSGTEYSPLSPLYQTNSIRNNNFNEANVNNHNVVRQLSYVEDKEITPTLPPPNQPPLSVYMETSKNNNLADVLSLLQHSKTIPVIDTVRQDSPQIFVGPSNLDPPAGYVKFELPYLSSLDSNNIFELPFFVAPLNFRPPPGFSKIPFPAPHIGSVVVSNSSILVDSEVKSTNTPKYTTHINIANMYTIPPSISSINPQLPSLINSLQEEDFTSNTQPQFDHTQTVLTTTSAAEITTESVKPQTRRPLYRGNHRGYSSSTTSLPTRARLPTTRSRRPYNGRPYTSRYTTTTPTISTTIVTTTQQNEPTLNINDINNYHSSTNRENSEVKSIPYDSDELTIYKQEHTSNKNQVTQSNVYREQQNPHILHDQRQHIVQSNSNPQHNQAYLLENAEPQQLQPEIRLQQPLPQLSQPSIVNTKFNKYTPIDDIHLYRTQIEQNSESSIRHTNDFKENDGSSGHYQSVGLATTSSSLPIKTALDDIGYINTDKLRNSDENLRIKFQNDPESINFRIQPGSLNDYTPSTDHQPINEPIIYTEINQYPTSARPNTHIPTEVQHRQKDRGKETYFINHKDNSNSRNPLEETTHFITNSDSTTQSNEGVTNSLNNDLFSVKQRQKFNIRGRLPVDSTISSQTYKYEQFEEQLSETTTTEKPTYKVRVRSRIRGRPTLKPRPVTTTEEPNYPSVTTIKHKYKSYNNDDKNYEDYDIITKSPAINTYVNENLQTNLKLPVKRPQRPLTTTTTTTAAPKTVIPTSGTRYLIRTRRPSQLQTKLTSGKSRIRRPTQPTPSTTTTVPTTTEYLTTQQWLTTTRRLPLEYDTGIRVENESHQNYNLYENTSPVHIDETPRTEKSQLKKIKYTSSRTQNNEEYFPTRSQGIQEVKPIRVQNNNEYLTTLTQNIQELPPTRTQHAEYIPSRTQNIQDFKSSRVQNNEEYIAPSRIQGNQEFRPLRTQIKTENKPVRVHYNQNPKTINDDKFHAVSSTEIPIPVNHKPDNELTYNSNSNIYNEQFSTQPNHVTPRQKDKNSNRVIQSQLDKQRQQKESEDFWNQAVTIQQSQSFVFDPETTILTTPGSGSSKNKQSNFDYDDYFNFQEQNFASASDQSSFASNNQHITLNNINLVNDLKNSDKIVNDKNSDVPQSISHEDSKQITENSNHTEVKSINKDEISAQPKINDSRTDGIQENKPTKVGRRKGAWVRVRVKKPKDVFETAESQSIGSLNGNSVEKSNKFTDSKSWHQRKKEKLVDTVKIEEINDSLPTVTESSIQTNDDNNLDNNSETTTLIIDNDFTTPFIESTTTDSTTSIIDETTTAIPTENYETTTIENVIISTQEEDKQAQKILGTSTTTEISLETEICYRGRCVKTKSNKHNKSTDDLMPVE